MNVAAKWQQLGVAAYNIVLTFVPSHTVRLGALRLWGASIGEGSTVSRGTTVFDIGRIVIGRDCSIGFRCLLDARGTITLGDNVVLASDTQIITGTHIIDSDTFDAEFSPVVIDSFAWVASRCTILPGVSIGRGAVVGACSLVRSDVAAMDVAAGVPATKRGERSSSLAYSAKFRRLFY
ncbi:DapH/DapD/GlmU-related protein [Subtercola sp. Z020]|uniref:acyltransferase n=1 Tax=Subtercola sp. Z020 TaxID=2080582 RepID=UPI0011B059FC|nr:acyltransferase [Subtercola sp. Z020]